MSGKGTLREVSAHHGLRILAALAGLAVVVVVVRSAELHAAINAAFLAAERVMVDHTVRGMVIFVLLSAVSAMIAFFSSAVLVPVGVYAWGATTTGFLLWFGWLLGGAAAYATGRYLGRPVVAWLVHEDRLQAAERRITANARFVVIVLFQMALPSEVPGYIVGVVRYRFVRYLGALALAELPFAAGAVLLGESFIAGDFRRLLWAGLALIALSAVAIAAWHRINGNPRLAYPRRTSSATESR
jgi:uncharacterized membrane protein YdjX (TVP38/TMEM64 family)